jgi:hypothetical protein
MPGDFDPVLFSSLIARFAVEKVTVLRTRDTHVVYRLTCHDHSYILKWFFSPAKSIEPIIYTMLSQYGIPILPVYENTGRALILEDLESSPNWRLAEPSDMELAAIGVALAKWYRSLRQVGYEALKDPHWPRDGVTPWVEQITGSSLKKAGALFKVDNAPAWMAAVEYAPVLKSRYLALPQTFNFNDFAAENLALSRDPGQPLRAIVFDYDCFASGVAYSDWRNVMYSLQGAAKASFQENYGPIAEEERLLDAPLAILHALIIASQRSRIPSWANPLVENVVNGELERMIRVGLEVDEPRIQRVG